ncbi:probable G-protein coupled receptor 33 [Elgaria multicarinata webbii]|uniref:probable G-protein coupled receptor 33 n=1 Tax=Elgaria multicarinata webbii TaxID=159646 RepID=UPI002FCD4BC9
MTTYFGNISVKQMNGSHHLVDITSTNIAIASLILLSFLVGMTMNGLFLWVLGVKIKRTVNTLWFLHLILTYLIFCSFLPFLAVHALLGNHWIFGRVMCKLLNTLGSLGMFTMVFLLTIISLDRYLIICHPIWTNHNRTIPQAHRLLALMWLFSLVLSAPYLAFRDTRVVEKGRILCVNNYAFSNDWDTDTTQVIRYRVHLALFVVRFLLAFLFPSFIIIGCSYRMGQEMKKKNFVRKTGKPFRILVASVASFFICWLPYHLYQASWLTGKLSEATEQVLWVIMTAAICFNFCFTPILYLFVGEKFQQIFKTSIVALLQKGFADAPIIFVNEANSAERVC